MEEITKEQFDKYNKNHGECCPYCETMWLLRWSELEWTDDGATGTVECRSCHKSWAEIMKRVDVIPIS